MSLTSRIRSALAELHNEIEQLPFARAMAAGEVERDRYGMLLDQLHPIHAELENQMRRHNLFSLLGQPEEARSLVIERDLRALGVAAYHGPWPETCNLRARFQQWGNENPPALIGAYYVLEGSRLGSLALARPLAHGLNVRPLPGEGLDYHLEGASQRMPLWLAFKSRLDALPLSESQQRAIVMAAEETMSSLHSIYRRAGDSLSNDAEQQQVRTLAMVAS